MVILYLIMTLWKTVLHATLAILALELLAMIKGFVSQMQHGQEQYQHAYVSNSKFITSN